jgi:ElaB/YqjD/DUF883 family membrane-anchored ribosome-binding protein
MVDQTQANARERSDTAGPTGPSDVDEGAILRQRIQRLQDDIEGLAHDVNAIGRREAERGREAVQQTGRRLEQQARENPLATLVITLIGGLIVGLLLGERSRR